MEDPKFILDVHLGRLAKHLRLLGMDTLYQKDLSDPEIIDISRKEKRIIISRDKDLVNNKAVISSFRIMSQKPEVQLTEMTKRFGLKSIMNPFTRCMICNSLLTVVKKEEISDHLLPRTKEFYTEFKRCSGCGKIYWEGSHYEKMKSQIEKMLG